MPAIVELPKRQRSGAFKFSDSERDETLKLLSEAKTGQAVSVTDEFKAKDYKPKTSKDKNGKETKLTAAQVARNVVSGRNNTIRAALEPHIDDNYHVKMHVIETAKDTYIGAVSLRKGPKPERKSKNES